jgi:hypothetical protein
MASIQATIPESSNTAPGAAPPAVGEPQPSTPPETAASDAEKREALIRIAAYSFYERRGCVSGHELEDWLQAEMEVDRQLSGAQAPRQTN